MAASGGSTPTWLSGNHKRFDKDALYPTMGWIGGYTLLIKGLTVDAYLKLVAPSVILWLEQSVNAWSDRPIKERASKPLEGRLNKTHIPDWGRPVGGPWEGFYSERR